MKGLVIKDLMCMKKQLIIFAYVVVSVLIVSIMFVLSARFGNIAAAGKEMMLENSMTDIDVKNLATMALMLFMLLPIAVVGDFSAIFKEDGKAGFSKVSSSLPLSIEKRVLAKYITIFIMFGTGVLIDLVISFALSQLTDMITFYEFVGIIVSAASVMSIYGALVIVFCFLFRNGNEDYASLFSIFCMLVGTLICNASKVKHIFINIAGGGETGVEDYFNDMISFFMHKSYILLIIVVVMMAISYVTSVAIAKRKRGVV